MGLKVEWVGGGGLRPDDDEPDDEAALLAQQIQNAKQLADALGREPEVPGQAEYVAGRIRENGTG